MATVKYVDPGSMDKTIDIWDRPPNAPPVLFASGIPAQLLPVASTSASTSAPALGQNTAWPHLVGGPQLAIVGMSIIIRYLAGVKSRMYAIYNHPDNGPMIFDFDRVWDPDFHQQQLNIVAFQRADGADPFDALLTSTLDVLERDTTTGDKRGMSSPAFNTIASNIPCRVAMGQVAPAGKEDRAKMKIALAYRKVYIRPWFADPSPDGTYVPFYVYNGVTYNTQPLTHDHFFLIPSASAVNSNNQPIPGEYYDVTDIDNPGLVHHHLEVACQVIIP
jgi:hypothetical protein